MSRSRARKNRNKFREIRTKHLNFVVMVIDSENGNARVYPRMFNTMPDLDDSKFTKEMMRAFGQGNKGCYSVSTHIGEVASRMWEEGLKRAQEAEANGELLYPTIKQQDSSAMEHNLDMMCKIMGVSRENLEINAPVAFASSVEKSVSEAIKNLRNIERVRFRGPAISKLPETKTDEIAPCPWLSKLDLAGVWSDPVEVTHVQGHSFEEVKFSSMDNLAKALKRSNSLEYIKKTAEVLGEDIKIDDIFLGESIGMIRRRSDTWEMDEVKKDSHEWAIVMVAFCRYPELAEQLKTEGHTLTEVQRSTIDENNLAMTNDIYYLFNTEHDMGLEPFKPMYFFEGGWDIGGQVMESIKRFNDQKIVTTHLDWSLPEDK